MKILITESQLQKILLEVEEGDPVKSGEKKTPTPKTKEYWDPNNPNCIGCLTDNGRRTDIVKVKSGKKSGGKISLTSDSAPYYEKMVDRMNADGLFFKSASGYRPYKTQFDLVDWATYEDSVKTVDVLPIKQIKKIGTWQTKSNVQGKPAKVAVPGTSNHGKGHAVDVDGCTGCEYSDAQNWVRKNGEVYGWYWGEVKSENWHFTFDTSTIDEKLINLMEELQKEIENANFAIGEGGDPKFEYNDYCLKIKRLDDKGVSLLGNSTLPPNVDSNNVKEYCEDILEIEKLPTLTPKITNLTQNKYELKYDEYMYELFKDYDLENMTKRELKKLVRKVKEDGREDLVSTIKYHIPTPLKDLYDIYIRK